MPRPGIYDEYADFTELVPGVFYLPGEGVYIVDDQGEVASWNCDEWAEDPSAVTATVVAGILAAVRGAAAVRENIARRGAVVAGLIRATHDAVHSLE